MKIIKALLFFVIVFGVINLPLVAFADPLKDDAQLFIKQCGKPQIDDTTAYDKPRPPIVSRWIVYKKVHTKIMFIQKSGNVGDPPPYQWKIYGALDTRTQQPLKTDEIKNRLACWHPE